ncbi:MAG: HAMP domain-containing sensor histidine kinase [Bacteroidota bacterium]|nr:HAMP domain-containing sensor histidine kinase [Bacteroidota bacterium]MDP3145657.1 HAMP domain-containing sensor histidine kinase [Bacteroidota bacterium]MDP3558669.1 HAMP domain-containing sensor histidine kinase [Bacteroidota bacterium]
MKIRTRITLQFSIIVSIILIGFSFTIYFLLSNFRNQEFNDRLKDKALTTVKLLSDVDEVNNELLKIIDRNIVNPLPEEKVFIYDFEGKLVYCSLEIDVDEIEKNILNKIRLEKEIQFATNDRESVGILFVGKYDTYIVVASAFDKYGLSKLNYLRIVLFVGIIISIVLIIVIGLFFSKQALSPISNVVNQIDKITASNLNLRVDEGNAKDEIAQLAIKFNKMLERLDAAFETQRSFVSNASHELRTPLTALTGQLEVALMNEETNNPWEVLRTLLNDIKQLNKLSNGLLDLAQANLDVSEIKLEVIRIDELIGLARAELIKRNKNYKLVLNFDEFPDEKWLTLRANEQLLKSALVNIMENACKYSSNFTAEITLKFDNQNISISIADKGIGIEEADLQNIFEPFFRSRNAKVFSGHGIGLTLTKKIIELHKGKIVVNSKLGEGTVVTVVIPHL